MNNFETLKNVIIQHSANKNWEFASKEWDVIRLCESDDDCENTCICGKENLRWLYTIYNRFTGEILSPIGSSCISYFNRYDMNEKVNLMKQCRMIAEGITPDTCDSIDLFKKYGGRKLLDYLFAKYPNQRGTITIFRYKFNNRSLKPSWVEIFPNVCKKIYTLIYLTDNDFGGIIK